MHVNSTKAQGHDPHGAPDSAPDPHGQLVETSDAALLSSHRASKTVSELPDFATGFG